MEAPCRGEADLLIRDRPRSVHQSKTRRNANVRPYYNDAESNQLIFGFLLLELGLQ